MHLIKILLRLSNERNFWLHFNYLEIIETKIESQVCIVFDLIKALFAICMSRTRMATRRDQLFKYFAMLVEDRKQLLRRNKAARTALSAITLSPEKRNKVAADVMNRLAQLLKQQESRDQATQFVLTFIAPWLDVPVRAKGETVAARTHCS